MNKSKNNFNCQQIDESSDMSSAKDQAFADQYDSQDEKLIESFDDQRLVELHKIYGNKWKKISSCFSNINDSFIKNHFYSLLRRSLRKINSYTKKKNKFQNVKYKLLKLNFVFKLTNLAESQRTRTSNNNNYKYYTDLLYKFLQFRTFVFQKLNKETFQNVKNDVCLLKQKFQTNQMIQNLINQLKQIELFFLQNNLNKKGKSKKKCPKKLQLKKDIIDKFTNKNSSSSQNMDIQFSQIQETQMKTLLSPTKTKFSFNEEQNKLQNYDFDDELSFGINFNGFSFDSPYDPILFK